MAITSSEMSCGKTPSRGSAQSSKYSCRLLKLNIAPESIASNATSKCGKSKHNNTRSPYLTGDRVQLLSRVIEKRFVHNPNFVSSFPLAAKLYKVNSDDLKPAKRAAKKVKKSVLTLPNNPVPVTQLCTVSDMNESEYFDKNYADRKRKVVKKRAPIKKNKKARVREKNIEFYDRDAQYCSQLNINLDYSSTDMMKKFNGDEKRVCNRKKILPISNKTQASSNNLSDVWAVLRNINRLQFKPSPPMSEESIVQVKKKTQKNTKRKNHRDARLIETCQTQEFAYISSYELDVKSPGGTVSRASSIDRITVIDNQAHVSQICEEFEKKLLGKSDFLKDSNNTRNRIHKNRILCKSPKSKIKALGNAGNKDNKQLQQVVPKKKKKNHPNHAAEQINSELTNTSSGYRNSLVGADTLQPNDSFDIFLCKTENDSWTQPMNNNFVESNDSKLNNAERPDSYNSVDVATIIKEHEFTANTPKAVTPQHRKLRLVTTMPSSCTIPKLTTYEIKRRLSNMRFPIVVLGKDQVSSSIQVFDYDPPQFNGLDEHIWPFMVEWSSNALLGTRKYNNTLSRKCPSYLLNYNSASQIKSKARKGNTDVGSYLPVALKDNKQGIDYLSTNKKKAITTPTYNAEINDKIHQCIKKQKSIVQLKNKMINFLCKKSSNYDLNKDNESLPIKHENMSAVVENKVTAITNSPLKAGNILVQDRSKKSQIYKYPWAKAKKASDFIENVIKKIRSGVYYTQDRKGLCDVIYQIDMKEVSVQAELVVESSGFSQACHNKADLIHDERNTNKKNLISIPGFSNTLPLLEIKTLNMNQIAVKHRVTNITVHFDVSVPAKSGQYLTSPNKNLLLTPVETTEGTTVFKCETTIFNAMLPAELCTIIPEMMSTIIDLSKCSMESPALCLTKTDSWLSTITEQTRNENGSSSIKGAWISGSSELENILEGRFSKVNYKKPSTNKIEFKVKYNQCLIRELLPMDQTWIMLKDLLKSKENKLIAELNNSQYAHSQVSSQQSMKLCGVTDIQNHMLCTSVQRYKGDNKILTIASKTYNLVGIIEGMMRCHTHNLHINLKISSYFDMLNQYDGKNIQATVSTTDHFGIQKNVSVSVSNFKIEMLSKVFPIINNYNKHQMSRNNTPLECIEYIKTPQARNLQNTKLTKVTHNKIKRKGFSKLYRKCKSPNLSSGDLHTSTTKTELDKITTLDDFFKVLGSQNIYSSVFDGTAAKKILSSVMEMKNWISEINPKQALLILLLVNKKETQNLVRFRPIILQGIAVNRITRASELDMEIEVIDRENLNKLPQPKQFEGITYLPESVTDYENLLDELYWIAKTTASDYKKPFDETSERLLKSLLQKRKKLNPSYLRVMARYVGLGLVKTPTER